MKEAKGERETINEYIRKEKQ